MLLMIVLFHTLYILWIPTPSNQASPASNLQPELVWRRWS